MHAKITPEHLGRGAVVYVRQSTIGQVVEHTESQRRQYALAETARALGFASVTVIDDDLGRSGSGLVERPGFQKLVAAVCSGFAGAVFCLEASRLARNGRDWHHLIDLCALVGTLVVDPDGTYDPRLVNDRLLLGLKGTMSEYELSLLRQRGIAARDSKALRGELRFILPPGYCWNEIGQIEIDPNERVSGVIRLLFDKFQELGSARQVLLWAQDQALQLPITRRNNSSVCKIEWRPAAYHTVLQILRHPVYAGAGACPGAGRGLRSHDPAHAYCRRACPQNHRPHEADDRLERPDTRSPPRLYQLGAVRGEPEADLGERPYAAPDRAEVGARRSRAADRAGPLRALRPDDAGVLRHAIGPCPPIPLSRRRQSCRRVVVHRHRRRPDRSRRRGADRRGGFRTRR